MIDGLRSIVGDAHVLVDADVRAGYEVDWTGRFRGTPSVASGGKLIDLDNKNWLSDLTK